MLGQEVEVGLRRALDATARRAARADRVDRLLDVVGRRARVAVRVRPARQTLLLVVLENGVAGGRQDPEHQQRRHDRRDPERSEMHPACPGEEEDARERRRVDHRGAEVGLEEDEQDRPGREADRRKHRAAVADPLRPVGQQPCEEEDEQQLPELRGLELEETEVQPALRPAGDCTGEQHDHHQPERSAVDRLSMPPVVLRVDEDRCNEHQRAEPRVDALPEDVVVRVAGHVVSGDPGDRPEAEGDQRTGRRKQDPVEPADDRGDLDLLVAAAPQPARPGVDGLNHSSPAPRRPSVEL